MLGGAGGKTTVDLKRGRIDGMLLIFCQRKGGWRWAEGRDGARAGGSMICLWRGREGDFFRGGGQGESL